ncbi:MAG: hypothetical protein ACI4MH_01595 [Candidatus Coproplasma sp.]
MEEMEEKSISIGEIIKVIFKKVWWVVGVTAAFMLVFVLVVQLWYNHNSQEYKLSYNMYFPGMSSGTYPDGTTYRMYDLVSEDVLLDIQQNSNGELDSVDISKMVANDGISIERVTIAADESKNIQADEYITVSVSTKYFKDADQAAVLLKAIANYPINYTKTSLENLTYDANLRYYENEYYVDYEGKIDYLTAQRNYLLGMYDSLIGATNSDYNVSYVNSLGAITTETLAQYRSICAMVLNDVQLSELKSELSAERYQYDAERYISIANNQKTVLNTERGYLVTEKNQLTTERDALYNSIVSSGGSVTTIIIELESYNNRIIELTSEINKIDVQLAEIDKNLAAIENIDSEKEAAFNAKLDTYYTQLQEQTKIFKTVRMNVYDEEAYVRIRTNKIVAEGGLNIILAALIGAILGFVAVCVVICIIDVPKYLKERDGVSAEGAKENEGKKEDKKDEE